MIYIHKNGISYCECDLKLLVYLWLLSGVMIFLNCANISWTANVQGLLAGTSASILLGVAVTGYVFMAQGQGSLMWLQYEPLITWSTFSQILTIHEDVIKWKHFPRYWPFVRGIHRSPVNSPQKGQWRGALMFSLICAWINVWVNNRYAVDLRRHCTHYDVTVMRYPYQSHKPLSKTMVAHWRMYGSSDPNQLNKQRVLMHRHQGWNVRHGLCHIYMRYLYIYELFIAFVCFVVCSLL